MHRHPGILWPLALLVALTIGKTARAYDWEITRLDEREGFMHGESLAVGPDGVIYVSYVMAHNPPAMAGDVYVARRDAGVWTRTLVSDDFDGFGTSVAVNPLTGQPGVVYQVTAGSGGLNVGFREFDGVEWVERDLPETPVASTYGLAYTTSGEAHISYGIETTIAGEAIWFSRVVRKTADGWRDVPVPIQGDWLSLVARGAHVVAAGTSATRGQPGLRWLDVMPFLPEIPVAGTVDQLPTEAVNGDVAVRTPGLAIRPDGHLLISYCSAYTTDTEDVVELKLVQSSPAGLSEPEVLLGGGSIADPTGYSLALGFRVYVSAMVTDDAIPFVFGIPWDYTALNVAMPRPDGWTVATIDTAGTCCGVWRGHSAGLDPETNTPVVAYTKGNAWQQDSAIHVAQLIPPSGDFDADEDVDLTDFAAFAECQGGPDQLPNEAPTIDECLRVFDFNLDGDVDSQDFARFQREFGG